MYSELAQVEHVFMLVKTYPTPSATYGELVCTAGIRLRDNTWVRIYPYPFRLLDEDRRFRKGNIIQVPLLKAKGDPRPESYKIANVYDIQTVDHLNTKNSWAQRMAYIGPTVLNSVNELKQGMFPEENEYGKVWGPSILPVRVQAGSAELTWRGRRGWDENQLAKLRRAEEFVRANLFLNPQMKKSFRLLERVPYEFRLRYRDATGEPQKHLILDWEVAQLYFNCRNRVGTDEEALEQVRHKIEEDIFNEKNDVYLILGNIHYKYRNANVVAIDGFIYPRRPPLPKQQLQDGLF